MNLLSQPPKPHPAFTLEIFNSADFKVTFRIPALFLLFIVLFRFAFFVVGGVYSLFYSTGFFNSLIFFFLLKCSHILP